MMILNYKYQLFRYLRLKMDNVSPLRISSMEICGNLSDYIQEWEVDAE